MDRGVFGTPVRRVLSDARGAWDRARAESFEGSFLYCTRDLDRS